LTPPIIVLRIARYNEEIGCPVIPMCSPELELFLRGSPLVVMLKRPMPSDASSSSKALISIILSVMNSSSRACLDECLCLKLSEAFLKVSSDP
jgi:hypothetical protein